MSVLGTDISRWQDDPNTVKEIDFEMMKLAGAKFVFFKASQAKFTDKVYLRSFEDAKGLLLRGTYHYLDWSISGLEQAKYFCDVISGNEQELPPVVDFEERKNVPPRAAANGHLWNWLQYVEENTGRIPIIYTGPDYWMNYGSKNKGWLKYPLWIANPGKLKPTVPLPWTDYIFWQFSWKGDGALYGAESHSIDLDYFNGSYDDLLAFCGTTPPVPVPTLEQRVSALETEAKAHGWNI